MQDTLSRPRPLTTRFGKENNRKIRRKFLKKEEVLFALILTGVVAYVTLYAHYTLSNLKNTSMSPYVPFVIVSYSHAGADLLGDLMQQHPDSFYVNEPLDPLHKVFTVNQTQINLELLNGSFMSLGVEQYSLKSVMVIGSYLTCYFHNMDTMTLSNRYLGKAMKTKKFRQCMSRHNSTLNIHGNIKMCLPSLVTQCESSKYRFVKTTQAPTHIFSSFMKLFPDMKIIHLLRDPRAIVYQHTQENPNNSDWSSGQRYARKLCDKMTYDSFDLDVLAVDHSSRVMTVYYEDLVTRPVEWTKALYKFTGMDFNLDIEEYTLDKIKPLENDTSYGAVAWRSKMKFHKAWVVDIECSEFYTKSGYKFAKQPEDLPKLSNDLWPRNRSGIKITQT